MSPLRFSALGATYSHIEDVIGRRYIQADGDMCGCLYAPEGGGVVGVTFCYPPEPGEAVPFSALDEKSKVELLTTYVAWDGFEYVQARIVIRNVLDGRPPAEWMEGIDREALRVEIEVDTYAARVRDYGVADAATYAQRVAVGADTVSHLESAHEQDARTVIANIGERAKPPGMPLPSTPKNARSRAKPIDIDLDR